MHVAEHYNLVISVARLGKLLGIVYGGVEEFRRVLPATVKINSEHVASVVSVDDAIRVEHWDDLEDELLSKHLCIFVALLEKEVNDALAHE